jgi:hypothetical protein
MKISLPLFSKISINLLASRWHFKLWTKVLYIDTNIPSIFDTKLKVGLNVWTNKVCVMCHLVHVIHKWGMFFHKLGGDTTFHNLENCNTISSKVDQFCWQG